jgi:redox-sensitive bicupin YhaK (pirin superfamily)
MKPTSSPAARRTTEPDARLRVRRAGERGQGGAAWLDARHSFSFADYYDPQWMGFRSLRVINEDRVAAGAGFPTHGHANMEILTWPLAGELEHKDSTGAGSVLRPGMMQYMSAGRGVLHSEFNPNSERELHLLQIWIEPNVKNGAPRYAERDFSGEFDGSWKMVAAPGGADGALPIQQDARVFVVQLEAGGTARQTLPAGRHLWLQVARGSALVNGHRVEAGDALYGADVTEVEASGEARAELLLFDLP